MVTKKTELKESPKVETKSLVDNSLAAKIQRSGLFLVNDHSAGGGPYVGISPQSDPKASEDSKSHSSVTTLIIAEPHTGMIVRPDGEAAFTIGEGFGQDSSPEDWAKVTRPDGTLLFADS